MILLVKYSGLFYGKLPIKGIPYEVPILVIGKVDSMAIIGQQQEIEVFDQLYRSNQTELAYHRIVSDNQEDLQYYTSTASFFSFFTFSLSFILRNLFIDTYNPFFSAASFYSLNYAVLLEILAAFTHLLIYSNLL